MEQETKTLVLFVIFKKNQRLMKDNNVYRKMDNGRYVPVGVYCGDEKI